MYIEVKKITELYFAFSEIGLKSGQIQFCIQVQFTCMHIHTLYLYKHNYASIEFREVIPQHGTP